MNDRMCRHRPGGPRRLAGRRLCLKTLAAAAAVAPLCRAPDLAARTGLLDPEGLERVRARAAELDQLNSLIVAREGEILLAEAFRGPSLDEPVNVKSVSKTIVASLTGAALDRGVLDSVDQRLVDLIPDLVPADAEPQLREVTLAHLLTMQAGLERTSGENYGQWVTSDNWIAHALSRPFVAEPGGRMLYSTGSYHLLGAILARSTGRSLLALARDWLGAPLDIAIPPWTRDPQGFYMGGNNMALSPMALFRFGLMWRQGGIWEGRRVLGRSWIEASWTQRARSPWSGDSYGYGWFLTRLRGQDISYARGYGGQMIYLVPALELTVVVTSDPTRPARSHGYVGALERMLADDIIAAATSV